MSDDATSLYIHHRRGARAGVRIGQQRLEVGREQAPGAGGRGSRQLALRLALFCWAASAVATNGAAPLEKGWSRANYTKREYRIPMRDGVKLFTVVYSPKGRTRDYPILVQRTCYDLKPYTIDAVGRPGDFRKAVRRVYRSATHPSAVRLRVMPASP